MGRLEGIQTVEVTSRAEWRTWLATHHVQPDSVWCVTYKKGASKPKVAYDDLVEEALCFGWIDSAVRRLDAERTMLLMSPRKARSAWSAANKARVERLIAEGLMRPPGLAKIEAAKRDGLWTKLDAVEALEAPADLIAAFRRHLAAQSNWDAFPRGVRRGILEWIETAKRPETRAKRIEETASLAARGERAN